MKKNSKKFKFGFLGYEILISVRYPAQQKKIRIEIDPYRLLISYKNLFLRSVKSFNIFLLKHLLYISITALSVCIYLFLNSYLIPSYSTRPIKNLDKIIPIIAGLESKKVINNKSANDRIVFNGPRNSKKISLTFDADMTPEMKQKLITGQVSSYYDSRLIQILKDTNTKATLFISGLFIELYSETTKELSQNSLFELANHSYSHPGFDGECYGLRPIPDSEDKEELLKTQELLMKVAGSENHLFRFPGGCYSKTDLDEVKKQNLVAIQWDVAAIDGFNEDRDSIISNVLTNVQNGSIIVMHMNGFPNEPQTANALPVIISELKNRGFIFVTLTELLNIKSKENLDIRDLINPYFKNR